MTKDNLYNRLEYWSEKNPNKTFIVDIKNNYQLTYYEFKNLVDNIIRYLPKKTINLLLLSDDSILSSLLYIATLSSGHRLIPLHNESLDSDIKKAIYEFKPSIFIADKNFRSSKNDTLFIKKEDFFNIISRKKTNKIRINSIGELSLATSGSTGMPKKILLNESKLFNTASNVMNVHQSREDDNCLNFLLFSHINAPVIALSSTLISGGMIVNSKFSKTNFWNLVNEFDITWVNAVPTIINILLDNCNNTKSSHLKFIRTGSAPISKDIIQKFEEKFNIPIIETYGATEACSQITANTLKERKIGSVGKPQGLDLIICDKDDPGIKELNNNKIGEVCIKGYSVIDKYKDKGFENNFSDGYFKTGDLGYQDDEGYIFLTSRKKDVIISKGENIYPKEIEDIIIKYDGVSEVSVIGEKDTILGERIIAFIILDKNKYFNQIEFKNWINNNLAKYKIPSKFFFVSDFPRLRSYKIDKIALKEYINKEVTIEG